MAWTVERDEHGTPLRMAWVDVRPADGVLDEFARRQDRAPLILVASPEAEPRGMYCTPLNPHP